MIRVVGNRSFDKSKIHRILIRGSNWVGDVVMSIPALEAVRENFPASHISILAKPWVMPLLENHPAVDEVLPYNRSKGALYDLAEITRAARMIRGLKFEMAILFQNAFEAAIIAYLGGIKYRVGYNTDGRRFLLTHAVICDDDILKVHQVEYYLYILRAMGWQAKSKDPLVFVSDKDIETVDALLLSNGVFPEQCLVGLSPGAVFGPAKRWPPERFGVIGDWAVQRWGARVVLMGSDSERGICRGVSESMKHPSVDLCGETTLGEVMALIKRCHFFVTNDSGLMHIAAALNVPTIAIFGSTNPLATGPRSKTARVVQHKAGCAPCLKPYCPTDFRCMLGIKPEDVWREMEKLRGESR